MEKQIKQKWLVGERVIITKAMEPCLESVPSHRLVALGWISGVRLMFPRTKELRRVAYEVELDSELLGCSKWAIVPGYDSMELEVID